MKILLALFLSLSTIAAHASVATYSFGGAFNAPIRSAIPGQTSAEPIFWGLAAEGDRFSGSFTFDTSAATPDPEFAGVSSAPLLGFGLQASERFNSALTSWQLGSIRIADDPDYSELVVSMLMRLDDAHFMTAILRMTPSSNDAFAGGVVPDGFNDFSGANLFLTIFHERELVRDEAYGSALIGLGNEIPAPAPVPEPATAALLLAGLAGLLARRRRA